MSQLFAGHRTPGYKLSNQRLNPGGNVRGLTPQNLSAGGTIQAPRVSIHSGNVQYTPTPIPKIATNNTLGAMAKFGEVWADRAFRFQLREAKVKADHVVIQYNETVRAALLGKTGEDGEFIPGYVHSEGLLAEAEYGDFENRVNTTFDAMLDKAEPRVRHQALLRMASMRDTILGRASIHRSRELKVAEDQARYLRQKDTIRNMVMDPGLIYKPDPTTGLNLKDEFYSECIDPETCDGEWQDLISEVQEKIYLEDGLTKAKWFHDNVALPELMTSPKHLTSAMGNIHRWEHDRVRTSNSTAELKLKQEKAARKAVFNETEKMTEALSARGITFTRSQVADMILSETMDPGYARNYIKDVYGEYDALADPEVYQKYIDMLTEHAGTGFVAPDGVNWSRTYLRDDRLDPFTRGELHRLESNFSDPNFQNQFSDLKSAIDDWTAGPPWKRNIFSQELQEKKRLAYREARARLASGKESYETVYESLEKRYNPIQLAIDDLPTPRYGVKPTNPKEVRIALEFAKDNLEKGIWDSGTFDAEIAILSQYQFAFEDYIPPPLPAIIEPADPTEGEEPGPTNIVEPQDVTDTEEPEWKTNTGK